ncbi:MAG: 2-oxo acid dehydrogenase subunit E2 [Myxococcota bacterium]
MSAEDGTTTVVPLRGIRGMVAAKMLASATGTAPVTHHALADVSALEARKEALARDGRKVSVEDLVLEAVVRCLGRHRWLNGRIEDREVRLEARIHLSVAIALPDNGLVAPTIFDAQELDVEGLRERRRDLSARARTNALRVPEMTGGTFTVSNLGRSRVRFFTPLLNAPQIAILGLGTTERVAVPDAEGGLTWRPRMGLSLTFDHRAVDGAPAAAFLGDVCATLEGTAR